MLGKKHTPEALAKIGEAGRGRRRSEETRRRMSEAAKRRGVSRSAVEASVAKRRGRPLSDEHKAKIARSTVGRKPVECIETGERFASIAEAARILGVDEASIHQAIRKGCRCRGYHYRRA